MLKQFLILLLFYLLVQYHRQPQHQRLMEENFWLNGSRLTSGSISMKKRTKHSVLSVGKHMMSWKFHFHAQAQMTIRCMKRLFEKVSTVGKTASTDLRVMKKQRYTEQRLHLYCQEKPRTLPKWFPTKNCNPDAKLESVWLRFSIPSSTLPCKMCPYEVIQKAGRILFNCYTWDPKIVRY